MPVQVPDKDNHGAWQACRRLNLNAGNDTHTVGEINYTLPRDHIDDAADRRRLSYTAISDNGEAVAATDDGGEFLPFDDLLILTELSDCRQRLLLAHRPEQCQIQLGIDLAAHVRGDIYAVKILQCNQPFGFSSLPD